MAFAIVATAKTSTKESPSARIGANNVDYSRAQFSVYAFFYEVKIEINQLKLFFKEKLSNVVRIYISYIF
jgi:hypothetical protein